MVCVRVGEHSSRTGFHHQVHGPEYWYLKTKVGLFLYFFNGICSRFYDLCFTSNISTQACYKTNFTLEKEKKKKKTLKSVQIIFLTLVKRHKDVGENVHKIFPFLRWGQLPAL